MYLGRVLAVYNRKKNKWSDIVTKRIFPGYFCNVRSILAFGLVILLSFIGTPGLVGQITPSPTPQVSPAGDAGDYIVSFREGTSVSERAAAARSAGAMLRFNYNIVNAVALHVPSAAVLARLQNDPRVAAVIVDRAVHAHQAQGQGKGGQKGKPPKDEPPPEESVPPPQEVPAGVERIGAAAAQVSLTARTGNGVGVAVVDTGIDFAHLDLDLNLEVEGSNSFNAFGGSCQDDYGHGTHVAGIIAARNNTIDVVGVAPDATVYCVKVLDVAGNGTDSTIMAGLDWIAANATIVSPPIRVVNMSLGRTGTLDDNSVLRSAVQALTKPANLGGPGITVVVSAGNDPSTEVSQQVPATYPEVMAIASTTALPTESNKCRRLRGFVIQADTASWFTTDGTFDVATGIGVTASAPGEKQENISKGCFVESVGILSTALGGGTTRLFGTSMSAPHVTGLVALMYEQDPTLTPDSARTSIRGTTDQFGAAPLDSPTNGYSYDGEREGIVSASGVL